MGSCLSSGASVPTAMLMVEDGSVEEYVSPVKVADILRERRRCFVCDSDSLVLDDFLRPLRPEHHLQLNHLYFLLPLEKLQHRLTSSEMLALAAKSCAAKKRSGCKSSSKVRSLDTMNGHQFHELHLEDLGQVKESVEALITPRNLAKASTSVSVDKSKGGICRQTSTWKTRRPMLSPIPESPLNPYFDSN